MVKRHVTIIKSNQQSKKYFENAEAATGGVQPWTCRFIKKETLAQVFQRYSTSRRTRNTITWKLLFRRKRIFVSKLDLSEAIN